jgi:hypothetical protein
MIGGTTMKSRGQLASEILNRFERGMIFAATGYVMAEARGVKLPKDGETPWTPPPEEIFAFFDDADIKTLKRIRDKARNIPS